jgi:hypothetical protein
MGKTALIPAFLAVGALALTALPSNAAQPPSESELASAFRAASAKYDVPREVLVGVGFAETHLDGHDGTPSQANGYGVMHLVSNNKNATMSEASKLTGLPVGKWSKLRDQGGYMTNIYIQDPNPKRSAICWHRRTPSWRPPDSRSGSRS